ncbi:unnamed protein product, partial [Ectocarpus fasciculatus]
CATYKNDSIVFCVTAGCVVLYCTVLYCCVVLCRACLRQADLPVDYAKAAERYLKASDAKHAEALFGMGYMHQMGKGVPQDLFLAKRYFDQAAVVSSDAVPVARLSLFLLRVQSAWMRWRDWWREIRPGRAAGDGEDGVDGRRKEEE